MADPSTLPPLPKDHLDHPEQWATGQDPATSKQKGFIKVLEGQHTDLVPEQGLNVDDMGKSEASEVIDKLKKGEAVAAPGTTENGSAGEENAGESEGQEADRGSDSSKKRKEPPSGSTIRSTAVEPGTPPSGAQGQLSGSMEEEEANNGRVGKEAGQDDKEKLAKEEEEAKDEDEDEANRTAKKAKVDASGKEQDGDDEIEIDDEKPPARPANPGPNEQPAESEAKVDSDTSKPAVSTTNGTTNKAAPQAEETIPGDGVHLDHPENWATGDDPATEKQKAYVSVLEKQKGVEVDHKASLGKSEASEKIDELMKL